MTKYTLGQRVRVRARLVRDGGWQRFECEPFEGIVTGYRTRNQGGWEYEDGGKWWQFGEGFQAMIVTTHLHRTPEHCLEIDVIDAAQMIHEWPPYVDHPCVQTIDPSAERSIDDTEPMFSLAAEPIPRKAREE